MSGSTEYRTPRPFFAKLWNEFRFNVDAAATDANALVGPHRCPQYLPYLATDGLDETGRWCNSCDRYLGRYYTAEMDGTRFSHYGPEDRVWCNPPYSPAPVLYHFVETAALTSRFSGATWVMLLNSTCRDTRWYHNFVWDRELHRPRDRVELREYTGRLSFLLPDGTPAKNPRHGNMVVVFRPPLVML